MPHKFSNMRKPAMTAMAAALALTLASLGLAACGGSSSTSTTQTVANAARTGTATTGATTTGATTTGTTSSGGTSSGTSSTPTTPAVRPNPARFTAMRACLAKKGITLPPRTPGSAGGFPGGGPRLPKGVTRAQYAEALRSCGGAGFRGNRFSKGRGAFNSPRFHEVLVRFATCLRQNGVNVGEPNTTGKGPIFNTKGLNTGSPQFKSAEAKCRSTLFSGQPKTASPGAAGGGATG
jgi:hypothetical protein